MKNVRAKKHLGQHFLNDERIAFDITDLLSDDAKNVVEIGPGMGVLTQFLVKKDFITEAVEIDTESEQDLSTIEELIEALKRLSEYIE